MIIFATIGLLLVASQALKIDIQTCDGVLVNGVNYDKEVLYEIDHSPYQLAIDYDTNKLFFSYTDDDDDNEKLKSAYLDLTNNKFHPINGIDGGFANTVDKDTKTVYLGGSDGIYTFDSKTGTATKLNVTEDSIWQLYYSNNAVYYTSYPEQKLYKYKDGKSNIVSKLADTNIKVAFVDKNENVFFSNSSGLYSYKKETDVVEFIGKNELNCFTTDKNGRIYFSDYDGMYEINDNGKVKIVAIISGLFGVSIEQNGNIIYASKSSIVRLKPSNTKC